LRTCSASGLRTRARSASPRPKLPEVAALWRTAFGRAARVTAIFAGLLVAGPLLAACGQGPSVNIHASLPHSYAWKSSAKLGLWNTNGFDVFNNEWNQSQAGPQTIWADSYQRWGVVSKQPGSTSVKTYPCVQQNYHNPRLGSITSLSSTFAEEMPRASANYDAEAAYDMFLNSYHGEVMVWVDNHHQTPEGSVISHAEISGRQYNVYHGTTHMFSFVLAGHQESAGHVNLLSALQWLIRHHYFSDSTKLTQVNFGFEIASTDGVPMNFTVTRFALRTNAQ